jgi:hypothetical protein
MRPGWNATRRNRNIGTARSGHGQDNRLVIPWPRNDSRPFWGRIGTHTTVTRPVWGKPVSVLVEPTRAGSVHACTVDDVFRMLELIPAADREGVRLVILRQAKRKEETLRSCWGRLGYYVEVGPHGSPAVILEAVDLSRTRRWPRSLIPDDAAELERLRADGHRITTTKREHVVHVDVSSARATQLYRTLPHEIGHWLDYLEKVERPSRSAGADWLALRDRYDQRTAAEKESFAHRYADELGARLRARGRIPFERILDAHSLRRDGLREVDFIAEDERPSRRRH